MDNAGTVVRVRGTCEVGAWHATELSRLMRSPHLEAPSCQVSFPGLVSGKDHAQFCMHESSVEAGDG